MPKNGNVKLDRNFYKDIAWFCQFLEVFNGIIKIHQINVKKSFDLCGCFFERNGGKKW